MFRTGFFGPALCSSAVIADYDNTAGGTWAWLAAVHGTQPGDPDKGGIRAKITAVSDDLDRTAALSRSTDFAVAATR